MLQSRLVNWRKTRWVRDVAVKSLHPPIHVHVDLGSSIKIAVERKPVSSHVKPNSLFLFVFNIYPMLHSIYHSAITQFQITLIVYSWDGEGGEKGGSLDKRL